MYSLADRLRWARTRAKLSQEALGKKVGVRQSTIGNLEAGTRSSARKLPQIAAELGVSALWLAEGKGEPTVPMEPSENYNQLIAAASAAARDLIGAILEADKAGAPEQEFKLILRMIPDPNEPFDMNLP